MDIENFERLYLFLENAIRKLIQGMELSQEEINFLSNISKETILNITKRMTPSLIMNLKLEDPQQELDAIAAMVGKISNITYTNEIQPYQIYHNNITTIDTIRNDKIQKGTTR
jgi:hypothetical protein